MVRVNDLIPISSGSASLGVNQAGDSQFDAFSITPFSHIHMNSGVWHDSLLGESGVIRYSRAAAAFQISVDGGLTFNNLVTAGGTVTSVGVIGGANLTGNVDFASATSGFIAITDTAGASPIFWAVNTLGLSGLWSFPSNGFPSTIPRSFAATFASQSTWTVTHNIGTTDVLVIVYDANSPRRVIIPDEIETTSTTVVTITFNQLTSGRVVVMGAV